MHADLAMYVARSKGRNRVEFFLVETKPFPSFLAIEITEGCLIENLMEVASVLKGLREMGVLIAVDDFGTGYSSLAYLEAQGWFLVQGYLVSKQIDEHIFEQQFLTPTRISSYKR